VAVVPSVLLGHVGIDPAQRQRATAHADELIVQRCPGHRLARQVAFFGEGLEVSLGPVRIGLLEGYVLAVIKPRQRFTAEADSARANRQHWVYWRTHRLSVYARKTSWMGHSTQYAGW
jgi:hypothetical protein